jgi:hypothetical protein
MVILESRSRRGSENNISNIEDEAIKHRLADLVFLFGNIRGSAAANKKHRTETMSNNT